jgi:L-ribulokinase
MTSLKPVRYDPIPENQKVYDELYALYGQLHDAFGGVRTNVDLSRLMKQLIQIRTVAAQ